MKITKLSAFLASTSAVTFGLLSGRAADALWTNVNGGIFNNPGNWSGNVFPAAGDDLVFGGLGTYTVTFNQGSTHHTARILRGDVTFDFDLTSPSADPLNDALRTTKTGTDLPNGVSLRVGGTDVDSPAPRLTITGGTVRTVTIGVSGPRGLSPAVLRVDGSDGVLQATGSGVFTTIGSAGEGRLEIVNGGTVLSNSVRVGTGTGLVGGHGSILIRGVGSSWTANAFNFANFSNSIDRNSASMVIEDGGMLSVSAVDNREFGAVIITGSGSRWENRGGMDYRAGSIDIRAGGWLSAAAGINLGHSSVSGLTSYANIRVGGADSEGVSSHLTGTVLNLGWSFSSRTARGFVEAFDGGTATFSENVSLGRQQAASMGVFTVNGVGTRLDVTGTGASHGIFVGGSSADAQGSGYVTVTAGGVISTASANGLRLYADGHLSGNGLVEGYVENRGHLAPSMRYTMLREVPGVKNLTLSETRGPASTLTIDGDYTQTSAGHLNVLLGLVHDQLHVKGDAQLSGGLSATLAEGFAPTPGQVFRVLRTDGLRIGEFTGLGQGAKLGNYGATDLHVRYAPTGPGAVSLFAVNAPAPAPAVVNDPLPLGRFADEVRAKTYAAGQNHTFIATYQDRWGDSVATQSVNANVTRDNGLWIEQTGVVDTRFWFSESRAETYLAASTSLGVLRAEARAQTTDAAELRPFATAINRWWDYFLIEGGEGAGTVNFNFKLHGEMGTEAESQLLFAVEARDLGDVTRLSQREAIFMHSSIYGGAAGFDEEFTASFAFTYGVPFQVDTALQLHAQGNGWVDFSGTATVLGIQVFDGGTIYSAGLIEGLADPSIYGFSAIPEPSTTAILAGWLALSTTLGRRRRARSPLRRDLGGEIST